MFLSTRIVVMTTHPGRVFHEFVVDEPEPRSSTFRTSRRASPSSVADLSSILTGRDAGGRIAAQLPSDE